MVNPTNTMLNQENSLRKPLVLQTENVTSLFQSQQVYEHMNFNECSSKVGLEVRVEIVK